MTTIARARLALAALCLVSLTAMDAMAHVRTPDFSRLDRNLGGVLPEPDSRGSMYFNWASSTGSLPSRERARRAKMSRMS